MFRNESTAVVKKAKAKEALKKSKPSSEKAAVKSAVASMKPGEEVLDHVFLGEAKQRDWTFPRYNNGPPKHATHPSPSTGPSIMPTLVDAATAFFVQNFVIGLAPPSQKANGDKQALVCSSATQFYPLGLRRFVDTVGLQ